jgi:methylation protein EvaC
VKRCFICDFEIEPFISFGKMPIANGFLKAEEFDDEYFYELAVAWCPRCNMVQLLEQPAKERMFNDKYAFFSGTSNAMGLHFQQFADSVANGYLTPADPFVVEIGSNDGIMLQHFAQRGIRHLGVEPSSNVADVAVTKGINTVCRFFDEQLALQIVSEHGQADAFLGANVMCHIPYLHSVLEGIDLLLKPDGIVMFEDPYMANVIENVSYDQFYDEHVFLFSLLSIGYLFEQHGMEVIDLEPQWTHGGSMRYVIARKGRRAVSSIVEKHRQHERKVGLDGPDVYRIFRKSCERSRNLLVSLLRTSRKNGERIVGYAATSKSTTIINYCGIDSELIEYISDTTPIKQDKFSPGAHIPIRSHDQFSRDYPDYALLFAYNHMKEIMEKESDFMRSGGKWIVYVPEVKVLE